MFSLPLRRFFARRIGEIGEGEVGGPVGGVGRIGGRIQLDRLDAAGGINRAQAMHERRKLANADVFESQENHQLMVIAFGETHWPIGLDAGEILGNSRRGGGLANAAVHVRAVEAGGDEPRGGFARFQIA